MLRVNSANTGIDHGEVALFSDFEDNGEMWRGDGPRLSQVNVKFSEKYRRVPHVQVSVSMLDMSNSSNFRMDVQAEKITLTGFQIVFRTWSDTQIARARVAWTSIGELLNEDDWDVV